MLMDSDLRHALAKEFEHWPEAVAEGVTRDEIAEAERRLGVALPDDYVEFLELFGGGIVRGRSIFGLRKPPLMPDEPALFTEQTERFWRELPMPYSHMVVVSMDDSGNPIGFMPDDRAVFAFDFDFGGRHELATTFESYLGGLMGLGSSRRR